MSTYFLLLFFFILFFMRSTFNPADYTANSGARQEAWEDDGNESERTSKKMTHESFLNEFSNLFISM